MFSTAMPRKKNAWMLFGNIRSREIEKIKYKEKCYSVDDEKILLCIETTFMFCIVVEILKLDI